MRSITAILSLCLWHLASATPVMPPNSTTMYHRELPSHHPIKPLVHHPHATVENIRAATHKARAGGYSNVLASKKLSTHNYTLTGAHFPARDASLKSHCKQNSTSFVDTTAAGSPPTAHCAALVDQILRDNANQTCLTYGLAPTNNTNTNATHSNTTTNLIASSGKCALSVTVDTAAVASTFIGIGDVVFVVQESIRRFSKNPGGGALPPDDCGNTTMTGPGNGTAGARVGGAGAFECGASGAEKGKFVNWALVHV
ncbi:hypothetical protein F4814DRAFT_452312 [Daldinia grandis]|nr:hypothetical protein F4814DRAFT_452312 [Daldinia grandis]